MGVGNGVIGCGHKTLTVTGAGKTRGAGSGEVATSKRRGMLRGVSPPFTDVLPAPRTPQFSPHENI